MCRPNNCSKWYTMHHISLFDNPVEPVRTVSPTIWIFLHCWNHHCIFANWIMSYPLLRLLARFSKGQYRCPVGRRFWNSRICFGRVQLKNNTGKQRTLPLKVLSRLLSIYWTQMLWNLGVIPLLAVLYSRVQSSPRRSIDIEQWNLLTVVWQPILKFTKHSVKNYILIRSEH